MSIIFFGDVGRDLHAAARLQSREAVLIDRNNYLFYLEAKNLPPVCYTSLGDLSADLPSVYALLDLADEIRYHPPAEWSDQKSMQWGNLSESIAGLSNLVMMDFYKIKKNVAGFLPPINYPPVFTQLADSRRTDDRQLWIAGCSISHGTGVSDSQRYGQLVADFLNLPVSFLTDEGSSVEWAADQILRSDIRNNDLVIWGLTHDARTTWFDAQFQTIHHIIPANIDYKQPKHRLMFTELLSSQNSTYKSIISVNQVINYCAKIKANLIILGLISSDTVNLNLHHLLEFEPISHLKHHPKFIDLGTDNVHPGPRQHQIYYQFCLQQLKQKNLLEI